MVKWQYLSKQNAWESLREGFEILSDATHQFTSSGIIKIAVPENIAEGNAPMMPLGLSWLKAATTADVRSVCETLGIFTQATRATAKIAEGSSDKMRLDTLLPAEQIAKLEVADAAIKSVKQPFESFGGRSNEVGNDFYVRVSERLRHKGRAATTFDYERLTLETFPDIFKTKCITHSLALSANTYQLDLQRAPSFVTLAVIPNLMRLKAGNSFEPRVSLRVLDDIRQYLAAHASPFVRLRVVNPRYEKVDVAFTVKFLKGRNVAFFKQKLEDDLRLFLAPWYLGDSSKLSFGQPIYQSDILTFIDQRDYVDFVKCLTVTTELPECPTTPSVSTNLCDQTDGVFRPLTPRSIFTPGQINITAMPETCED